MENKENKEDKNKNINKKNDNFKLKFMIDLLNDSYSFYSFNNNSFVVFKSLDSIIYIIYSNKNNSLISYNLGNRQKISEIKNAHNISISNIRFYLDKINKKDLIISASADDNNIKLWNIKNFECLYNFKNINKTGFLYSACFLNDNMYNYIITCNCTWKGISEPIKIFDFKGNKIKEINNSKDKTFFIDIFYDKQKKINYIITANKGHIKSYNYNTNNIYRIYCDNDQKEHDYAIINDFNEKKELIESSEDGNIRIWNFYSGNLLKKIKVSNDDLYGICLWNNKYLLVGCEEKTIKVLDLEKKIINNYIKGHNKYIISIRKMNLKKYGECLITQEAGNGSIKLWICEN